MLALDWARSLVSGSSLTIVAMKSLGEIRALGLVLALVAELLRKFVV